MSPNGTPVELTRLREKAGQARVSYEIFPILSCQPADEPIDWFEVVLHAEADIDRQLNCPESREAVAALKELADFLVRGIPAEGSVELNLPAWYYSAHPPTVGEGLGAVRLFRSLSLRWFNVPPYRKDEQPPLLAELKRRLHALDISQIKAER